MQVRLPEVPLLLRSLATFKTFSVRFSASDGFKPDG